jgi:PqqD family protein of HPr-rel-A system
MEHQGSEGQAPFELNEEPKASPDGEAMTVPADYRPTKAADVLELDMGDGVILYNHDSSLVHHLNPSAALLWKLCDGDASVGQLAEEIAEEYELDGERVGQEVSAVIAEFDALDLVADARDLLRRKDRQ